MLSSHSIRKALCPQMYLLPSNQGLLTFNYFLCRSLRLIPILLKTRPFPLP